MSSESREFVSMREGQFLSAAVESEKHQKPLEKSIGELCEDGTGRVGVCLCCGEVAVIPNMQHVGECCSTVGDDE